jgi:hypothetical protein
MRMLRSLLSHLRWYAVNMATYLSLPSPTTGARRTAIFDLEQNVFHRYLLNFMLMLHLEGFEVRLRHRPKAMGVWATNFLLRFVPGLKIQWGSRMPADTLVFTDRSRNANDIVLDPDYFDPAPPTPDTIVLPMSLVDTLYVRGLHAWMPDLDHLTRRPHLFFAGNLDSTHYNAEDLETLFGCMPRQRLISIIREAFPGRVRSPRSEAELLLPDVRDLVIIDRKQYNVPHDRLRPVLAGHDFFLAPPGVIMPLCHNVVEALSVGSIPVLQYADLMHPPLEHGVNCLSFRDQAGLTGILKDLPHLVDTDILRMRRNALAYYHEHLSPKAVAGRVLALGGTLRRIRMNAEHLSVDLLRARQVKRSKPQ